VGFGKTFSDLAKQAYEQPQYTLLFIEQVRQAAQDIQQANARQPIYDKLIRGMEVRSTGAYHTRTVSRVGGLAGRIAYELDYWRYTLRSVTGTNENHFEELTQSVRGFRRIAEAARTHKPIGSTQEAVANYTAACKRIQAGLDSLQHLEKILTREPYGKLYDLYELWPQELQHRYAQKERNVLRLNANLVHHTFIARRDLITRDLGVVNHMMYLLEARKQPHMHTLTPPPRKTLWEKAADGDPLEDPIDDLDAVESLEEHWRQLVGAPPRSQD
jgi:hypothetical protein